MGYFRDDQPLYELMLDERAAEASSTSCGGRWISSPPPTSARTWSCALRTGPEARRPLKDAEPSAHASLDDEGDHVRGQDQAGPEATWRARPANGNDVGDQGNRGLFQSGSTTGIRWVEQRAAERRAESLEALLEFAARAYRRPLTPAERDDLLRVLSPAGSSHGLDHETAMREAIVIVLMSPDFCYRIDLVGAGARASSPLSDYDLASRLSYFLWSSMPDEELLAHAAAGDLHEPEVIAAQARRMLQDPRARGAGGRVRRQLARFPPFRGNQHRRSRAFPSVHQRIARRRCSRSRFASSWTCSRTTVPCSISSMPTTRS